RERERGRKKEREEKERGRERGRGGRERARRKKEREKGGRERESIERVREKRGGKVGRGSVCVCVCVCVCVWCVCVCVHILSPVKKTSPKQKKPSHRGESSKERLDGYSLALSLSLFPSPSFCLPSPFTLPVVSVTHSVCAEMDQAFTDTNPS